MSIKKLPKSFYQSPALQIVQSFLGKFLVYNSPRGKISGVITDVEAYPGFIDNVSHGNMRTKRTQIMYKKGGYAYIYLIYGIHYQFAVTTNKTNIPDVVFIRAVKPCEGIDLMKQNFGREVKNTNDLTKSPGNLCKSFGIDMSLYGEDLTSSRLFIEDRGVVINDSDIKSTSRIGIDPKLKGSGNKFRYYILRKG